MPPWGPDSDLCPQGPCRPSVGEMIAFQQASTSMFTEPVPDEAQACPQRRAKQGLPHPSDRRGNGTYRGKGWPSESES